MTSERRLQQQRLASAGGLVIGDLLADYRAARREFEEAVMPLATSVDGRRFQFQSSLHGLAFEAGSYVMLDDGTSDRLGQILSVSLHRTKGDPSMVGGASMALRVALGDGVVLDGVRRPFHDATIRPAEAPEVRQWLETVYPRRATLEVGELLHVPRVPVTLDAGGFDRHTFLCGQSGSGKTYSLGVMLERLLLETGLRIIILDPNSDYVRLTETRLGVTGTLAARYAETAKHISVWLAGGEAGGGGGQRIRLTFAQLDATLQAALLRLDPIDDREEYGALSAILESREKGQPLISGLDELLGSELPGARELGMRAANLGVLDWSIWARGRGGSLLDEIDRPDVRCTIVDLGSLDTREEQRVVAEAVLATLWERRASRQPVLIVIDEAHNVCPAAPGDPVTALAAEHAVRIAAEGRKYGLYLLVSTQRPQKVQENLVSQCDNLVLMRMNSTADLKFIRAMFSFVPAGLLDRATTFGPGQALVAGKIASHAAHIQFGSRIAEEAGADVPAYWAAVGAR